MDQDEGRGGPPRRRGVGTPTGPYLTVGIGLLAAIAMTTAVGFFPFGGLVLHEAVPILTVGVGLGVLAWVERSRALAVAAGFFGLAVLFIGSHGLDRAVGVTLPYTGPGLVDPVLVAGLGVIVTTVGATFGLHQYRLGRRP